MTTWVTTREGSLASGSKVGRQQTSLIRHVVISSQTMIHFLGPLFSTSKRPPQETTGPGPTCLQCGPRSHLGSLGHLRLRNLCHVAGQEPTFHTPSPLYHQERTPSLPKWWVPVLLSGGRSSAIRLNLGRSPKNRRSLLQVVLRSQHRRIWTGMTQASPSHSYINWRSCTACSPTSCRALPRSNDPRA